jgi:flagellar motility protein MotE (MotC chaperone)
MTQYLEKYSPLQDEADSKQIKDLVTVGLLSTLLFPVVLILVLLLTGVVHLDLGMNKSTAKDMTQYLEKYSPLQDEADSKQSKLFQANQKKVLEIDEKEKKVIAEIERLESLKIENTDLKNEIEAQRTRIEALVGENRELSDKRIDALAQVYGSMKPIEAAPILLSLTEDQIAKIITKIPENRSKAKIMAAIGAMDRDRAAIITKILGWKNPDGVEQ